MKTTKDWLYFMRLPVLFILIAVVGTYLILVANGYIFNLQARKIEQTGMIYLKSDPKNVDVYLNGELKATKTPAKLPELLKGRYEVAIKKEGYHEWFKFYLVEKGYVNADDDIILFFENPEIISATEEEMKNFENYPQKLQQTNIEIKNENEIWLKSLNANEEDVLVTRLSDIIKNAVYYSDKKHIIYQVKNEIRAVDLDGTNNINLLNLESDARSDFMVDENGQYLFFTDNGLKKARIH